MGELTRGFEGLVDLRRDLQYGIDFAVDRFRGGTLANLQALPVGGRHSTTLTT